MEIINASITRMEEVEIFGIPALYTSYRVSRQTVHLGLYRYELWAGRPSGRQTQPPYGQGRSGVLRHSPYPCPRGGDRGPGPRHRPRGLPNRLAGGSLHPR